MIHHCVFFTFNDDCDQRERDEILSSLAQLVQEVPGMISLSYGPNADFEQKSPQHEDGFVAVFADRDSLSLYAANPNHLRLGQRLIANCVNGQDGIVVFDIVSDE